jgi:hypothetical protein
MMRSVPNDYQFEGNRFTFLQTLRLTWGATSSRFATLDFIDIACCADDVFLIGFGPLEKLNTTG